MPASISQKNIRPRTEKKKAPRRFLNPAIAFLILLSGGLLTIFGYYRYISDELPKITSLADYRPPIITTVYADDNRKIGEFFNERRIVVSLARMPGLLKKAFVAAEDTRFYKHTGIDPLSVIRAFFKNLAAGSIVQGGSTITQQVTKSFLLTPERSYRRKIKEAILAYRIDKRFSKDEILFLYLNQIYLGHGAYGVQAAAENYFGKSVEDLNLAECAILAGLPQAPSRYSPFQFPERAQNRQKYVLQRMEEDGYITGEQAATALKTPLDIKPRKNLYMEEAPFFTEHVRRYVVDKYGQEALYKEGLRIYTTVNVDMQKIAGEEVLAGLRDLDKRQGYRGPLDYLKPEAVEAFVRTAQTRMEETLPIAGEQYEGVVTGIDRETRIVAVQIGKHAGRLGEEDMRWARHANPDRTQYKDRAAHPGDVLAVGDVILVQVKGRGEEDPPVWDLTLEQTPKAQSALLCIETGTGHVKAMIGGRDFRDSQFNRAFQSRRQPGSAFKPIIYAAAIDKGYTPASMLIDSPIVYEKNRDTEAWKPKNYEGTFQGPILLRNALAKSRNVVTIKILQDIGVGYAIDYARKLGITSPLSRDLSIALGSSGVSLLELVNAYSVFANLGDRVTPVFITRILDRDGNVIEETRPQREPVIDKSTAYIMTSLLESVVKSGTGQRVKALGRPVAGKTGTTNNLYDAWFVGYTPQMVTGVWVGFDDEAPLGRGETGSRTASPIWLGFMKRVLADKPVRAFQVPEDVVFCKIDEETGLLPIPESKEVFFECFKEGSAPTHYTPRPGTVNEAADLFKSDI